MYGSMPSLQSAIGLPEATGMCHVGFVWDQLGLLRFVFRSELSWVEGGCTLWLAVFRRDIASGRVHASLLLRILGGAAACFCRPPPPF